MGETSLNLPEDHTSSKSRARLREQVILAALDHAPFDGWSNLTLRAAAQDLGMNQAEIARLFPGGPAEAAEAFFAWGDDQFRDTLNAKSLDNLKIRERVATAIKLRLEVDLPHREAARRALTQLLLPTSGLRGPRALARTVDQIWRGIGDTSADFNFYTKRATLSGVYSSTYLVWLADESEDFADTSAFLDRRIADVMQFEKTKAEVKRLAAKLPDPISLAARLRYGNRRWAAEFPWPTENRSLKQE